MLDQLIQDLHAFAWKPAPSRGKGGTKAVWTGEGKKRPLYGERAKRALSKKQPGAAPEAGPAQPGPTAQGQQARRNRKRPDEDDLPPAQEAAAQARQDALGRVVEARLGKLKQLGFEVPKLPDERTRNTNRPLWAVKYPDGSTRMTTREQLAELATGKNPDQVNPGPQPLGARADRMAAAGVAPAKAPAPAGAVFPKPLLPEPLPPVAPPAKLPPGVPPPPPAPPEQLAQVNAQFAGDKARFGAKIAEFVRGAAAYALGMLTAGNGAAWGAVAGLALGGPLGLGLGTALGGGLGARLGGTVARKAYSVLGGAGRTRATLRNVARAVAPVAAGVGVGGPVAALGVGGGLGTVASMGASGMIAVDAALGFPVTEAALDFAGAGAKAPGAAARATRRGMATSRVSARKATGTTNDADLAAKSPDLAYRVGVREADRMKGIEKRRARGFAEAPAPNSSAPAQAPENLDPVALLKARLKAITGTEPDEKLVLAALGMAALKDEEGGTAKAMSDATRALRKLAC